MSCNCTAAATTDPALNINPVSLPRSVCETSPCSTASNVAAIQAGYTPAPGTDCTPIYPEPTPEQLLAQRQYRPCTDPNGCTGLFPEECRDRFWPDFAHPRWLCCRDLYNAGSACCC